MLYWHVLPSFLLLRTSHQHTLSNWSSPVVLFCCKWVEWSGHPSFNKIALFVNLLLLTLSPSLHLLLLQSFFWWNHFLNLQTHIWFIMSYIAFKKNITVFDLIFDFWKFKTYFSSFSQNRKKFSLSISIKNCDLKTLFFATLLLLLRSRKIFSMHKKPIFYC